MSEAIGDVAVYTTIYPGVERYLADWYRSLQAQTDRSYRLCIGSDGLTQTDFENTIQNEVEAIWISATPGDTPAQIRQRSLAQLTLSFDAVILVDSDDILHDSRIAFARAALATTELAGCGLRLVDHARRDLGVSLNLQDAEPVDRILPRHNVFGLSNSAYRSTLLRRCFPIPAEVELVDWFLATRAWLLGAEMAFDSKPQMDYRQHECNMARIRGPFTEQQVLQDTELVRKHFRLLRATSSTDYLPGRFTELKKIADDIELFHMFATSDNEHLKKYVVALNKLVLPMIWWISVAHPALNYLWSDNSES